MEVQDSSAESRRSARLVSLPDKSWSRLQRLATEHGMTEDQILEVAINSFARPDTPSARPRVTEDAAPDTAVTDVVVGTADEFGRCGQRRAAGSGGWGSLPKEIAERLFQLLAEGSRTAIGSARRVNLHWKTLAALHTRHLGTDSAGSTGQGINLRAVMEDAMPKAMSESLGRLLSSFPYVTEVHLKLTHGMACTLKALDQLRELKHLSSLHLERPAAHLGDSHEDSSTKRFDLSHLAGFMDLASLSLYDLELIQSLPRQQPCTMPPKLTSIVLEQCDMEEFALICALENSSGLKSLTLEDCFVDLPGDAPPHIICQIGKLASLECLSLSRVECLGPSQQLPLLPGSSGRGLLELQDLTALRHLELRGVADEEVRRWAGLEGLLRHLSGLEVLVAYEVEVTDALLGSLACCSALTALHLSAFGPGVTPSAARSLFFSLSNLSGLFLYCSMLLDIDDAQQGAAWFKGACAVDSPGLRAAALLDCEAEETLDEFREALSSSQATQERLERLDLEECSGFCSRHPAALAAALPGLRRLHLVSAFANGEGAMWTVEMLRALGPLSSLRSLSVDTSLTEREASEVLPWVEDWGGSRFFPPQRLLVSTVPCGYHRQEQSDG